MALGSPRGVDGSFLRQFRLSYRQFVQAVAESSNDEALARWFLTLPSVTDGSIKSWNRHAPLLGSKGHPGYLIRHLVKWVYYSKILSVNNMIHCFPISACPNMGDQRGRNARRKRGASMGSVGRFWAAGRTLDSNAPAGVGQGLCPQTWWGAQTQRCAPGVRGHRVRVAHGLSVEGAAD